MDYQTSGPFQEMDIVADHLFPGARRTRNAKCLRPDMDPILGSDVPARKLFEIFHAHRRVLFKREVEGSVGRILRGEDGVNL